MEENGVGLMEERVAKKQAAEKIKRRKKRTKRIIGLGVTLLVVGGIAFGLYSLFHEKTPEQTVWSDMVVRGSIQSTVTGNGTTKAQNAATLTLTAGGLVREVFVTPGQQVKKGDPLYTVDATEAQKAVDDAKKNVANFQKQMDALNKSYSNLTMTAPFAGKLMGAEKLKVGEELATGKTVAKLVDDKTMKLSLYFSYAYEKDITPGKAAQISIPSTMNTIGGTVLAVNKVKRVSPEGSTLFEVVFTMANPGTLVGEMGATAVLKAADGTEIYPYEPGKLEYNRSQDLVSKAGGELVTVNLQDYSAVTAGQVLVQMKGDGNDDQMAALSTSMKAAQDALEKAEKNLANYNAVAPISGAVISCTLVPGETAESGRVAITIADTSVMTVAAQIDEMNVSFVKPGMSCDITQYGANGEQTFTGTVESVSLEGKFENGVSFFPAIIRVDNPEGALLTGMYVNYNMIASQSDDCLTVPQQAVKYTEAGTVLFIKAETAPENAVPPEKLGGAAVPEGYFAVPVTVGLSDQSKAEIVSGVEEGTEVFIQYMTDQGDSFNQGGNMGGGSVTVSAAMG